MTKLGWWDVGNEYSVAGAIRDLADTQHYEAEADLGLAEQIGRLDALRRQQAEHIARLELSLGVLSGVLAEAGLVSEEDLRERLESAWSAREAERKEKTKQHQHDTIACASCGVDVDRRQTLYSELGEVCPSCG
jgi:Zn finger protein HypA/HybF involved in hydrogenase expression